MKYSSHNSSNSLKPNTLFTYKIPSISLVVATMVLTACSSGGGGGGDQTQPALDQDCVDLFSSEPFNYPSNLIQLTCSDIDDFDDIPEGNLNFDDTDTTPPLQSNDATPDSSVDSITPSVTPALNTAPADVPGGLYFQNSNNSAILSGPLFGAGTRSNDSLVKPLAFSVNASESGLQLIELRAVDNGASKTSLLGVVQNTGTSMRCFVEAEGIKNYSASGAAVPGSVFDWAYSTGVVGAVPQSTVQTDTCIKPGGLAYLEHQTTSFAEISEVTIDSLNSLNRPYAQIQATVVPISYSTGTTGVDVTFVNQHSESVELFAVRAFALDTNGQAINTDTDLVMETLDPGQEFVVKGMFANFTGQASTMRVSADFDL